MKKDDKVIIKASNQDSEIVSVFNLNNTNYYEVAGSNKAYTDDELLVISPQFDEQQKTFSQYNAEIPRPLGVNDVFLPYSHEETKDEHELADAELGHRMAIEPKEQYDTDPGDEVEVTEPKVEDVEEDILKIIDDAIEGLNNLKEKYNA